jgi:hypothetical protein
MKLILRIIKWAAIGIFLILILLFSISIFLQDKIVNVFIGAINKNISTKIEVGSGSFSLINKFPKASVKLSDVYVHSSGMFDKSQFKGINTDTLLRAQTVSLEFKMTDLIIGIYNIESATVSNGTMNLFSDSSGMVNYEISNPGNSGSDDAFVINLDKIIVSDLSANYINTSTSLDIRGLIQNGRFKSKIAGNNIDFTASSSMQLSRLEIFPVMLKTRTSASLDLNLHQSDSGIFLKNGTLKIENFTFGISGMVYDDDRLDLKITGRNIDVSKIKKFLPAKYMNKVMEYEPAGILTIDCGLYGLLNRKNNPDIKINFSLEKGHVRYEKSKIELKNLGVSGSFGNGRLRGPESSTFAIDRFNASLGSATYSGSMALKNFNFPEIDIAFSGEIIPAELADFFDLKEITWSEGSVRLNLRLEGIFY